MFGDEVEVTAVEPLAEDFSNSGHGTGDYGFDSRKGALVGNKLDSSRVSQV